MTRNAAINSLANFMMYIDSPTGRKKYPELQDLVQYAKSRGYSEPIDENIDDVEKEIARIATAKNDGMESW